MIGKVIALKLDKRTSEALALQKVLTDNGCMVQLRVGLHEIGSVCSEEGMILLYARGENKEMENFEKALSSLSGIKVHAMSVD